MVNKKIEKKIVSDTIVNRLNILLYFLFIVSSMWLLGVYNYEFLYTVQEYSYFLPTMRFFTDAMHLPGGGITYIGGFLTQFFYYPWLGATIYVALLCLVQWLTYTTFRIRRRWFSLSFIPAVLLLITATEMGYMLYVVRYLPPVFPSILGFIASLLQLKLFRFFNHNPMRIPYAMLSVALLYPIAGVFALFGGLLIIVSEIAQLKRESIQSSILCMVATVASIIMVPLIAYYRVYERLNIYDIYKIGLPLYEFNTHEFYLWIAYILLAITAILFLSFTKQKEIVTPTLPIVVGGNFAIYTLLAAMVACLTFTDENFHAELKMSRAADNNNWKEVLKIAREIKGEPTRMMVMHANLAAFKLGIAGQMMFTLDTGSKKINAPRTVLFLQRGGTKFAYHYGQPYVSYRWCMEDIVEGGYKIVYFKQMAKAALFVGEYNLAAKYLNTLKATYFHKDWALKYLAMIDNKELLKNDPEFKTIAKLSNFENYLSGSVPEEEYRLMNFFTSLDGGTKEQKEMALISVLIMKEIDKFWPVFISYQATTAQSIPRHYQEAAILFAFLTDKDYKALPLDPIIKTRFDQFQNAISGMGDKTPEEISKKLSSKYRDTYWHYFFFCNDIELN